MNKVKGIFIGRHGGIRLGWLMLTAAVMYALAAACVYELYWRLYRTMMEIWCVTAENVARAPGWVQFLYSWSNVIVQLLESMVMVGFAEALGRMAGSERTQRAFSKGMIRSVGAAACCIAILWLILLLTGSVRLGWRLSRPDFSVSTLALLLTTFAAAAAEGCFLYGAVYGMMKKRLPGWAALLVTVVLNALMGGALLTLGLINGILMGGICCLLTDRGGVREAVGFRFAWSFLERAVFGFAGAAGALYETYPVNLYWLSGGNAGIMNGALTMLMLAAAFLLIRQDGPIGLLKLKKRSKSPS